MSQSPFASAVTTQQKINLCEFLAANLERRFGETIKVHQISSCSFRVNWFANDKHGLFPSPKLVRSCYYYACETPDGVVYEDRTIEGKPRRRI